MQSNYTSLGTGVPKIPLEVKQNLQMKAEERGDIKRGTPGYWVQNGTARPVYIPGWMVAAEELLKSYAVENAEHPALIVQIGPYWKGES